MITDIKRILKRSGFLILTVFLFSNFTSTEESKEEPETGESVAVSFFSSMERIGINQAPFGQREVNIKGARSEIVSFQVNIHALTKNIQVTRIETTALKRDKFNVIDVSEFSIYRAAYVPVREASPKAQTPPGLYADPLVPLTNPYDDNLNNNDKAFIPGLPFEVWKEQNQPLWIDLQIPENIRAGNYQGEITITFRDAPVQRQAVSEVESLSIPIRLQVWDFSIKGIKGMRNHFGGIERISYYFGVDENSEEFKKIAARYRMLMTENGINPPLPKELLPVMMNDGHLEISSEKTALLKEFISDYDLTDFPVPMPDRNYKTMAGSDRAKTLNYFKDYYSYLKANGWDEIAYVYMYDEPNTAEAYDRVLELGNLIHEASPHLKCLVVEQTYTQDPSWADIDPAVDIWCPLFSFIDRESINKKIEQGDEVWSYTALSQQAPPYAPRYETEKFFDPAYWHIDNYLSSYRIPAWMNRQYNITGLLYWSTMTEGVNQPWLRPTFRLEDLDFNGGGLLIYPGVPCNINGPIGSIRLKNIRDGLTDYKYFTLLEKLSDSETVIKYVSKIAPNWHDLNYDADSILSVREEIAEQIIKLSRQK